eukprot:EG_transcript_33614
MFDNLSSLSRSSSIEDPPASKAQCTPEGNKFKFVPNRGQKGKKIKRIFQKNWKEGREWLQYDAEKGMWCDICIQFRENPKVLGPPAKRNALATPTNNYDFKVVKRHAEGSYHLTASGLQKRLDTPVSQLPICLPT